MGGPLGLLGGAGGGFNMTQALDLARTFISVLESAQGGGNFNANAGGYGGNGQGSVGAGGFDVEVGVGGNQLRRGRF